MDSRVTRNPLGFFEVKNKPSPSELANYYENKYFQNEAGNYRQSYSKLELEMIRQRIVHKLHRVQSIRGRLDPGKVLDVGCGEGFTLAEFKERGWNVEGIDYSVSGTNSANPSVSEFVCQGDVFELLAQRVQEGLAYDVVWLNNVLEHVIEPVELLRSLRFLVDDGGVLVVTVPNDFSRLQETLFDSGDIPERFWIAMPDHLSYFDAESLNAVAKATGWQCLDVEADFPIDFYLAHAGSNYVVDPDQGQAAHRARLKIEELIFAAGEEPARKLFSALAAVGMGRNITAYLCP